MFFISSFSFTFSVFPRVVRPFFVFSALGKRLFLAGVSLGKRLFSQAVRPFFGGRRAYSGKENPR